jgi:hypothetical protein
MQSLARLLAQAAQVQVITFQVHRLLMAVAVAVLLQLAHKALVALVAVAQVITALESLEQQILAAVVVVEHQAVLLVVQALSLSSTQTQFQYLLAQVLQDQQPLLAALRLQPLQQVQGR